jgi:mono/diheme cytochrome c family protein
MIKLRTRIGSILLISLPVAGVAQTSLPGPSTGIDRLRAFDPAAVERGRTAFGGKCGSCHRANARGGQGFSGPDLIRSVLVLQDVNGRQIGAYLEAGHPDKSAPPIPLAAADITDLATFLHREITYAAERTNYQLQYVMTGNAKDGEAYFNGAAGCNSCHSPAGDLKGIGARYDGPMLQALIAFGTISGGGRGQGGAGASSRTARNATTPERRGPGCATATFPGCRSPILCRGTSTCCRNTPTPTFTTWRRTWRR